jgi:two-component system CheB/CheR fusion protein
MARAGLAFPLKLAVRKALARKGVFREKAVRVKTHKGHAVLNLSVWSLREPPELRGLVMVALQEVEEEKRLRKKRGKDGRGRHGEDKLRVTKHRLEGLMAEMDRTRQENESTNEELQSMNEELQSTNEELTTSKEEMQSLNEELHTVNHELQSKVDELSRSNNDMKNLLNSTDIATLFLDGELRVRRFTTATAKIIKLIPADVGRSITDIASDLAYPELAEDAREVLRRLVFQEAHAATRDGRYFTIRIMPYRTLENVIDGVVITFSDASVARALEITLQEQAQQLRQFTESLPVLVWGARADGAVDYLSRQWVAYTGIAEAEQLLWGWIEQLHPQDRESIRDEWRAAVKAGKMFEGEARIKDVAGAYRWFRTHAVPIRDPRGAITRWYATSIDVDDQKHAGGTRRQADRAATLLEHMREGFLELDGELLVTSVNQAVERMVDRDRSELVGRPVLDVFPAARGTAFEHELAAARSAGAQLAFDVTELVRGGGAYRVRLYPQREPELISVFLEHTDPTP